MAWWCVSTRGNQFGEPPGKGPFPAAQGLMKRARFIHRPDRSLVTKTGQIDVLLTVSVPMID